MLDSRAHWGEFLTIAAAGELQFWIGTYNSQPVWHSPFAVRVVFSDASESSYGGYMVECGPQVANGQWSPEEQKWSSTMRELTTLTKVLASFTPLVHSQWYPFGYYLNLVLD